jgi:Ca2+-binding EF-hand superfamily protein
MAAALAPPPPPPQQASSEELFSQLDTDGDGSITTSELSSALQTSSTSTSTDNGAALLKVLDSDNSGGVSSDELKAALQAGRDQPSTASSEKSELAQALGKMIADLNKQYQLDNGAQVGSSVNVAA